MRIIVSLITASVFAAGSTAWAEEAPAKPAKAETPAVSATPVPPDKSAEAAKPVVQAIIAKPRESGLNQPLCTGE